MSEWEWLHAALGGGATLLFLFQTLGALGGNAGLDSEVSFDTPEDIPADSSFGGDGDVGFFHYLSIRNFVALFMGYGWVTLAALLSGISRAMASLLGLCSGIALIFVSLYLIKMFLKFQEDGTLDLQSLVGKRASVYITVGGGSSGLGKVLVDTKTGRVELPARTNDPGPLRPGQLVTIQHVEDGILWVTFIGPDSL